MYPKLMRKGNAYTPARFWDVITVNNEEEEAAARKKGYHSYEL